MTQHRNGIQSNVQNNWIQMLWIQLKGAELEGHDVHSPIGIKLHMECLGFWSKSNCSNNSFTSGRSWQNGCWSWYQSSELVIGNFYKKNVLKNSEKKEAQVKANYKAKVAEKLISTGEVPIGKPTLVRRFSFSQEQQFQ